MPVDRLTGLCLEPAVQVHRVLSMRVVLREERSWPTRPAACHCGPVGELVLLEQHDIGLAHRGEVVGDAAADDAATDDHDARLDGTACRS